MFSHIYNFLAGASSSSSSRTITLYKCYTYTHHTQQHFPFPGRPVNRTHFFWGGEMYQEKTVSHSFSNVPALFLLSLVLYVMSLYRPLKQQCTLFFLDGALYYSYGSVLVSKACGHKSYYYYIMEDSPELSTSILELHLPAASGKRNRSKNVKKWKGKSKGKEDYSGLCVCVCVSVDRKTIGCPDIEKTLSAEEKQMKRGNLYSNEAIGNIIRYWWIGYYRKPSALKAVMMELYRSPFCILFIYIQCPYCSPPRNSSSNYGCRTPWATRPWLAIRWRRPPSLSTIPNHCQPSFRWSSSLSRWIIIRRSRRNATCITIIIIKRWCTLRPRPSD